MPVIKWRPTATGSISSDSPVAQSISIRETVLLPDRALIFLNYPPSVPLLTREDLDCVYFSANSSHEHVTKTPVGVEGGEDRDNQIVRCRLEPWDFNVSLVLNSNGHVPPGPSAVRWDSLAYAAIIDRDNTTIVFVKGLNLRPERLRDTSRYECVYGWDFSRPKYLLSSEVVSVAQEIVRCKTPLSVLSRMYNNSVKVSVRSKGRRIFPSIARPEPGLHPKHDPPARKKYEMCVCTMLRNQAQFFKEWAIYHANIGVQRWFVYDNNSDDDLEDVIEAVMGLLSKAKAHYNITRHLWPWIKTQEAGFAHCALRARDTCSWVGFIDVDEFFYLPSGLVLHDVLQNQSRYSYVGEVRVSCYSFGPSGLKHVPRQGVTVGYTCRMAAPERHKSIVRPEALNSTLINVVHHFHLRDGFEFVDVDKGVLAINHYKYQVWEVFKEKFYRRVATYVADWQNDKNVGSKDRAPGLGTKAIEPQDWASRFCEVSEYGLRNQVLKMFADPETQTLPWQEVDEQSNGTGLMT